MSFICDAVIFDNDGVLVDSNAIAERHLRVWTQRHGLPFEPFAAIHHGRQTIDTIRLAAPQLDAAAEALALETEEANDKEGLVAFAGAQRLVSALPEGRWAIATSGTRRTATMRIVHVGLPLPRVLITADDVVKGKPAPDPYRLAAKGLGLDPTRCVVIEDASAGIASARAAGARVIAVASTSSPAALADADVIVARLDDLEIDVLEQGLRISWPAG
jgi:sugar-phosphatase